ncbi:ImmA/IrrE family metallo-endopeptidase [Streptomyces sp. NBC_01601]|uniref:ImmA/IrrE family metallo-endopeptidase n=1 Tax=Streptomyces sp. NBC_01601 TaxID=2975892 RepID=UPI002E2C322B|nr:ImmA/IrrE family metallo-endopeptidase [Streptomyces sp. NBC_01601]
MSRLRRWKAPEWAAGASEQIAIRWETHKTAQLIRRDIGLSDVRDIKGLIDLVSSRRGKPIDVLYLPLPTTVSAFCISIAEMLFVVVDSTASELTQLHAILHELGHFLLDEDGDVEGAELNEPLPVELLEQLLPALNPEAVTAFFQRSHYDSKGERRVEAFATVMLERHLALRRDPDAGGLASTFTHRRTGV